MKRTIDLCIVLVVLAAFSPTMARAEGGLSRARFLVLEGRFEEARAVAQQHLDGGGGQRQEALQLVVATSCRMGDEETARRAFAELSGEGRQLAQRFCALRGINLVPDPRRPWRIAFFAGLTATVASAVATGILLARVGDLEDEKEDAIRDYRMQTGQHNWGATSDVCDEARQDGVAEVAEICDSGERTVAAGNVMLGVTAVSLIATGYLYYRGYIKRPEEPRSVAVLPSITRSGGGLALSLEF